MFSVFGYVNLCIFVDCYTSRNLLIIFLQSGDAEHRFVILVYILFPNTSFELFDCLKNSNLLIVIIIVFTASVILLFTCMKIKSPSNNMQCYKSTALLNYAWLNAYNTEVEFCCYFVSLIFYISEILIYGYNYINRYVNKETVIQLIKKYKQAVLDLNFTVIAFSGIATPCAIFCFVFGCEFKLMFY